MPITICIPKVYSKIKKSYIADVFNDFNLGPIKKIDLVKIKNSQRCFIHYYNFNDSNLSKKVTEYLDNDQDFKVMYNEPWYWKCSLYKN